MGKARSKTRPPLTVTVPTVPPNADEFVSEGIAPPAAPAAPAPKAAPPKAVPAKAAPPKPAPAKAAPPPEEEAPVSPAAPAPAELRPPSAPPPPEAPAARPQAPIAVTPQAVPMQGAFSAVVADLQPRKRGLVVRSGGKAVYKHTTYIDEDTDRAFRQICDRLNVRMADVLAKLIGGFVAEHRGVE